MMCSRRRCYYKQNPRCIRYFKPKPKAPENCKSFFDGCNWCDKKDPKGAAACTKKACKYNSEPYCKEYFEEEVEMEHVQQTAKSIMMVATGAISIRKLKVII